MEAIVDLDTTEITSTSAKASWTHLLPGYEYGGGFYVATLDDKDSASYLLIDLGAAGDSRKRRPDTDGVPDSETADGKMAWVKSGAFGDDEYLDVDSRHASDGKFSTDGYLAKIADGVANSGWSWTDYPVWNYVRLLREETGKSDCYIPSATTPAGGSNYFEVNWCGTDNTPPGWGNVAVNSSEYACLFMYLLNGYDPQQSKCDSAYYTDIETYVPDRLYRFYSKRPDNNNIGTDSLGELYHQTYWAAYEVSATNARGLRFDNAIFLSADKTTTYHARVVRRVYL